MNVKVRKNKNQDKVQNFSINVLHAEELKKKVSNIEKQLQSYTWRELETNGKFKKNDKLSFISDEMLIVGCDIGSETHYVRAIDTRGRELSKEAFCFSNNLNLLEVFFCVNFLTYLKYTGSSFVL